MKPKRKSSNREVFHRVAVVSAWLGHGCTRSEIHRLARKAWGISWRQSETYCSRARARLMEVEGRSKAEVRAQAICFYENVIKTSADVRVRILARMRLDRIYGVDAPKQSRVSVSSSPCPLVIAEPLNEAQVLDTAKELMAQFGLGNPRKLCGRRADGQGPSKGRGKSRT